MTVKPNKNDKQDQEHVYDDETINMLEKRREAYRKGNIKGLTVEESMEFVKQVLKKRGL